MITPILFDEVKDKIERPEERATRDDPSTAFRVLNFAVLLRPSEIETESGLQIYPTKTPELVLGRFSY